MKKRTEPVVLILLYSLIDSWFFRVNSGKKLPKYYSGKYLKLCRLSLFLCSFSITSTSSFIWATFFCSGLNCHKVHAYHI